MLVGRIARRLGVEARRAVMGGPQRILSTEEFLASGEWHEASRSRVIKRKPPRVFGQQDPGFGDLAEQLIPALGVHVLPRGKVICPEGWAVTTDGSLLSDCTWYGREFDSRILRIPYGKRQHLHGVALVLASDFSADNFGHLLMDGLSRALIAKKAGIDLSSIDWFVVPPSTSRTVMAAMAALQIDPAKCVWTSHGTFSADTLLVTSFPGLKRSYVDWVVEGFRDAAIRRQPSTRRLYIPRTGTRRLANEAELLPILSRYGFEVYDYKSEPDEVTAFAMAEAVVAPHSASMANILFSHPGTRILELLPSDHCHPYYYTLADAAGHDYSCIVGPSRGTRPKGTYGPSPFDFEVDPNDLEQALASILAD